MTDNAQQPTDDKEKKKPELDPNPANELGKNLLDPALEKRLLERGCIFARRVYSSDGKYSHIQSSTRPIDEVAYSIELDAIRTLYPQYAKYLANITYDSQVKS